MSPLGEGTDEDPQGIKQQTRSLKQGSMNSTGNALQLGDQSERLADTGPHPDALKGHSQRTEDKMVMMKQLNRTLYEEYQEREKTMVDIHETQNRLERATTYGITDDNNDEGIGCSRTMTTGAQLSMRKEQRKPFRSEATDSDGEMEDELDDNLSETSEMKERLKALRFAMEQELNRMQVNYRTPGRERISETDLSNIAKRNAERLKRIK